MSKFHSFFVYVIDLTGLLMSSPSLDSATNSLIELLNNMIDTKAELSEFDIARLKRDAKHLKKPESYSCLAAINSFIGDAGETKKFAELALNYRDFVVVENVFHALYNVKLYENICTYAVSQPWVLQDPHVLLAVYESALYTMNLEVCDMARERFNKTDNETLECLFKKHDTIKGFIYSSPHKEALTEYISYALAFFHEKIDKQHNCVFNVECMCDEGIKFMNIIITLRNTSMDNAIDLELYWFEYISKFNMDAAVKSLVSFQLEGDSFND